MSEEAKNKALQLCQKFGAATMFSIDNKGMSLSLETAKKMARICVAEILLSDTKRKKFWSMVQGELKLAPPHGRKRL